MRLLLYAALLAHVAPASAHEFWIEPIDYTVDKNQPMLAEVRSGEHFLGDVFPFMPDA